MKALVIVLALLAPVLWTVAILIGEGKTHDVIVLWSVVFLFIAMMIAVVNTEDWTK